MHFQTQTRIEHKATWAMCCFCFQQKSKQSAIRDMAMTRQIQPQARRVCICLLVLCCLTSNKAAWPYSTMRSHLGCIFMATAEYTTAVWCAFYIYMRVMDILQWPLCGLGGEKNPDRDAHDAHGHGHGHVLVYARLRHIKRATRYAPCTVS